MSKPRHPGYLVAAQISTRVIDRIERRAIGDSVHD